MADDDDRNGRTDPASWDRLLDEVNCTNPAGLFGPESMIWEVGRYSSTLVAGPRALLMQISSPVIAQGVFDHSNYREKPSQRMRSTMRALSDMIFADREGVRDASLHVERAHQGVEGFIAPGTSRERAGERYSATSDPHRKWVHATIGEALVYGYEHTVRPLSDSEKEKFWQEFLTLGRFVGLDRGDLPGTWVEFTTYFNETIDENSEELAFGRTMQDIAEHLFNSPITRGPLDDWIGAETVPPHIRNAAGLRKSWRSAAAFHFVCFAAKVANRVLPKGWTHSKGYMSATKRIAAASPTAPADSSGDTRQPGSTSAGGDPAS